MKQDLRPSYFDKFHCLAADCKWTCCKGWTISFDKKDYLSLKKQKGSAELKKRIDHGIYRIRSGPFSAVHYGAFRMDSTGTCPLLREDGLCMLQVEKGGSSLPRVCRSFPRAESYMISGYFERSLTPACEAVLELLWNMPEGVDFFSDTLPRDMWRDVLFDPINQPIAPFFQQIREVCIDLLQNRSFPLPYRILMVGFALQELHDSGTDIKQWQEKARLLTKMQTEMVFSDESTKDTMLPKFLANNVYVLLLLQLQTTDREVRSTVQEILENLGLTAKQGASSTELVVSADVRRYIQARDRYTEQFKMQDYFMENLMVSLFFHLHLPEVTSLEAMWKSYVNFCNLYSFYRFMSVMSCRNESGEYKNEMFRLIVFASRCLIHSREQQTFLRDELFKNESATLAHMAVLLSG